MKEHLLAENLCWITHLGNQSGQAITTSHYKDNVARPNDFYPSTSDRLQLSSLTIRKHLHYV